MFDLKITSEDAALIEACREIYSAIAISHTKVQKLDRKTPQVSLGSAASFASPKEISELCFSIYYRLSLTLEDVAKVPSNLTSNLASEYDLISITPQSEKAFTLCCQTLEIDVISIDMSSKLDYYFRAPNIKSAISRGIMFEICYAGAFRDTTCRRNLLANATNLVRATNGKNIIISRYLILTK
jgi:ribonuclease P/MRP protein subunit RPP1